MIAFIEGRLIEKKPGMIVILQSGIGFVVEISLSAYYTLPDTDSPVSFYISTQFRDDAIRLFGFERPVERDVFEILLTVNRIGPKAALSILSGLKIENLVRAIQAEDVRSLSAVSGIGKKTAERIVFELKDKVTDLAVDIKPSAASDISSGVTVHQEIISICENLGYKRADIETVMKQLTVEEKNLDLPNVIRRILRSLSGRGIDHG